LLSIFSPFQNDLQDLSPLSLIRYPNFKGWGRCWRIASSSSQGQLVPASTISCAFSVRILSLSPPRPGPWINHFHKSYIKHILASHCIKRLHKYRTCFKSKNKRSIVNPFHNAMNLVFILVNASWSVVRRCPRKLSTSSINIKAGWSL
jgi:hypothetical protein